MWSKRNPLALSVRMQTGATTVEDRTEVPQKVKVELSNNTAIALLSFYPRNAKLLNERETRTLLFTAACLP